MYGSSSGQDVLERAAQTIRRSLRLPAVAIEVPRSGLSHTGAGNDAPGAAPRTEVWSIRYAGKPIARLRATPRRGERFSDTDREVLSELAGQLAPVVRAVSLAQALDSARAHLINVREEERRRLRADLHDELGATLAGLTLKAGLASGLVERNPSATRSILKEIETTLQESVLRVRELVEGLRPAHLDGSAWRRRSPSKASVSSTQTLASG